MANKSQLARTVATQLGRIQGEVEAKMVQEGFKLLNKFANQCPNVEALKDIIQVRNTLLTALNTFQQTTNKFNSITDPLSPIIRAANILISLLKRDPTPIAIGLPPNKDFGGLISSKTSGALNSSGDRLRETVEFLESLEADVEAVTSLVESVAPSLDQVRGILGLVNISTQECIENLLQSDQSEQGKEELERLLKDIQPLESATTGNIPAEEFTYRSVKGTDYTLAIITETSDNNIAPVRYAVAKDKIGVIVLRGQKSFSSNTKILLDELKFRIDNQLP
tara:strand:+ start:4838 stop:5677 length:840 start_codon:yes stop_codon:yes gene_type:complete